jgi:hypothetical protein
MRRLLLQHKRTLILLVLACAVVVVKTAIQLHYGFNLADEGFVWYGMQRVLHGEVPMRDFMAYDPARYYWGAALMSAMGSDGVIPFRLANAAFEVIGLFVAVQMISTVAGRRGWLFILFSCLAFSIWIIPRFKVYDHVASIALIASLAYLVETPTRRRYFFTGVVLGLAAFVGRNHGAYGLAAMGLTALYINLRDKPVPIGKAFLAWIAGVLVGHSPMILLMLFAPGFAYASVDMIRILIQAGKTNLPLPVPWPWAVEIPPMAPIEVKIGERIIGYFFVALLVFGVGSLIYIFWKRWKRVPVSPLLVSCSVLTLPYAHYAFARAEMNHLSFGGFPLFIGMLVLMRRFGTVAQTCFAFLFLAASIVITLPQQPRRWDTVPIVVDGTGLYASPLVASETAILDEIVRTYAPRGENFFIAPFYPSAYPMYRRRSPIWDLYSLFDRDEKLQLEEIKEIKASNPAFVLIIDAPPQRDPFLLFRHTNPLIWKYVLQNYDEVKGPPLMRHTRLFLPKKVSD